MKKLGEMFQNLLYPRCCPVCHRILREQDRLICRDCAASLRPYTGSRCMCCGKPVGEEREYCSACASRKRRFTEGMGIYLYDGRMRDSILKYKYGGRREYGDFYSAAMCRYGREKLAGWRPQLIVPVPLDRRKQRMRGFNQAGYLADRIGAFCGIPAVHDLAVKTRRTEPQKKLGASARRRNLQGAFQACRPVEKPRVLIVDDVYTTGSTVEALADCLKSAGAQEVYFLTVCTGIGED